MSGPAHRAREPWFVVQPQSLVGWLDRIIRSDGVGVGVLDVEDSVVFEVVEKGDFDAG